MKLEEAPLIGPIASEYDVDVRWLERHIIADAESWVEFKHDMDFCTPDCRLGMENESSGDRGRSSPYHDCTYDERMGLASAAYYAGLRVYEAGKGKNP